MKRDLGNGFTSVQTSTRINIFKDGVNILAALLEGRLNNTSDNVWNIYKGNPNDTTMNTVVRGCIGRTVWTHIREQMELLTTAS